MFEDDRSVSHENLLTYNLKVSETLELFVPPKLTMYAPLEIQYHERQTWNRPRPVLITPVGILDTHVCVAWTRLQ